MFEALIKKEARKWIAVDRAVDETEITINRATIFIWGAVDLDNEL